MCVIFPNRFCIWNTYIYITYFNSQYFDSRKKLVFPAGLCSRVLIFRWCPKGRRMPLVRVNPRKKWSWASENWTEGCQKWHETRIQCTAYGVDAHHICQSGRCTAKFLGGKIETSGLSELWCRFVWYVVEDSPEGCEACGLVKFLLQVKVWKWPICGCFLSRQKGVKQRNRKDKKGACAPMLDMIHDPVFPKMLLLQGFLLQV